MPGIRVRVATGPRVELHAIDAADLILGKSSECDLIIDHPTMADRHARLLVRRGRILVVDLGSEQGVRLPGSDQPIRAPIAIDAGRAIEMGEIELRAWASKEPTLVGESLGSFSIVSEIDSADDDLRRFHALDYRGRHAEVALAAGPISDAELTRWAERAEASARAAAGQPAPHLPAVVGYGWVRGRPYLMEAVPGGVRLAHVARAVAQGRLHLPIEARVAIAAQVTDAVAAAHIVWGPHGGIEPRSVQLGLGGSVSLLRAGPRPRGFDDPERRPFLAPERCYGAPATIEADAFSAGAIARLLGAFDNDSGWPEELRFTIARLRAEAPPERPRDLRCVARALREAACARGLDPSVAHVARVVRLLAPSLARPLARAGGQNRPIR